MKVQPMKPNQAMESEGGRPVEMKHPGGFHEHEQLRRSGHVGLNPGEQLASQRHLPADLSQTEGAPDHQPGQRGFCVWRRQFQGCKLVSLRGAVLSFELIDWPPDGFSLWPGERF